MTDPTATLESFAAIVVEKVAALSDHLGAQSIPNPTLKEAGHVGYQGESLALRQARYDLARAAKSLQLLAQGPEDTALSLFRSAFDASNMEVLLRFRFFDAVPLDATTKEDGISTADLAAKLDLPLDVTERIVDVGGSLGHASIALASAMPRATFLVQDATAATVEEGRALHDFFTPMPAEAVGAHVYLLQWILHDWTDADAVRILRGLVPALTKPGARVLISEAVRPAPPARLAHTLDERVVMEEDLIMLASHASKERSVDEFTSLFEEADARFRLVATGGGVDGAFRSVLEYELCA
ncbi:S-adenosyl-L-methionine-dependent methyltransferase [Apiospora saccharicola]